MLIDSHCHLDGQVFDGDRDEVIVRAREAGVELMLAIGTGSGPPDLEAALRLAQRHEEIYATAGVHPHDAAKASAQTLDALRSLCSQPKVLAVGEIGLDYHYDFSPQAVQKRVFIEQMGVAHEQGKPIVIHTREAWDDTLDLLRSHRAYTGLGGIMHCFSGELVHARAAIEMGFLISFGGMLTFARSADLRRTAAALPLDRLLVETDAPYLTPEPHRKIRRNEPRFVVDTARHLAAIRNEDFAEVAAATTSNFRKLFSLRGSA